MQDNRNLTEGVVWKRLFVFFLPIAAGTLIQQLYNAADGFIVGKLVGTGALAAVGGSAAQIINVLIGFFVAVTSGASVVIAQIFGAGRQEEVKKATSNAVLICSVIGVVLMAFGLMASPWMLSLLKTPADTMSDSILYLRIYFIGVPCVLVLNMESNLLRAVGDSKTPFFYMIISCVTNIILDFIFVYFFHWAIAGVAIATVIAQVLNMVLLTVRLVTTKESYRLELKEMRLNRQYIAAMMRIGIPSGLQSSMYSVSNMIIQIGVNSLGTVVVASWAMTSKTDGFYWAVTNALGSAITAFVGQNLGAGRHDRIKQCVKQGMILSFTTTVASSVLIMLAARPLLGILTDDAAVIETTFEMMTYFVPFYFTWTVIEVLSAVLRGSGDAVRPVIIIGIGICLFRVVWMATAFAYFHTLPVLCYSYVISWVITDVALIIYYRRGKWLERASGKILES